MRAVFVCRFAFVGLRLAVYCGHFADVLRAVCGWFAGGLRAICGWFAGDLRAVCGGLRAACVLRFVGDLREVCGRFMDGLRTVCGRIAVGVLRAVCERYAGGLRAVRVRFAAGFICSGFRLSVCDWRFAFGGLCLAVCVWRFAFDSLRLAVCAWWFALGGLRLAVRVWRFAGGWLAVLRRVCGRIADGFAGGLLLAVCERFASGKQAVVGRFAVGGLRDKHNATPNPIKLRIAQRWTSSSSLLKTKTMCVCMDVCVFVSSLWRLITEKWRELGW